MYCDERGCLTVRLFVHISQKPLVQTSSDFLRMLPVVVARSSSSSVATSCLLPVSWITSYFPVMGPTAQATQVGRKFKRTHRGTAPDQGRSLMSTVAL